MKYYLLEKKTGKILAKAKSISFVLMMARFFDTAAIETVIAYEVIE